MPYHRCPECALTVQSTAGHFAAKSCPRCSVPLERTDEIQRPERGSAEIGGRSVAAAGGPFRREALAPYAQPRLARSLLEVATSVVPYLGLCVLIYATLGVSRWLALALAIPTAGFLVRTFIVFHDCAHGSMLPSKRANTYLGALLGLFVLSPFRRWRHDHAVHHATSGDLERRGVGDVLTLTVAEYRARSWRGRLAYRLIRNPLVMFGLGPMFAMIVGPRLAASGARPRMRNSVLLTDVALAVVVGGLCWLIGWERFLLVWAPSALLAGSVGIWLFYVQHQFEDAYWQNAAGWNYDDAALRGSSYLKLPRLLQFFTGNIGLHHVHHLNARIPNYNLQAAHDENPMLHGVPTLSLWGGLRAVRLKLWDEEDGKLVTFAQAPLSRIPPRPRRCSTRASRTRVCSGRAAPARSRPGWRSLRR
jgi:omega-6 fatty acid desaturase (delta-12 desaturase)